MKLFRIKKYGDVRGNLKFEVQLQLILATQKQLPLKHIDDLVQFFMEHASPHYTTFEATVVPPAGDVLAARYSS